ncbi:MAG: pyridoxal phosphate-dependent aminotransferase [Acidobacteriota bacterium]
MTSSAVPTPRRRPPISAIRAAKARVVGDGRDVGAIDLTLGEPTWFAGASGLPTVARRALASVRSAPYGLHVGDLDLRQAVARFEGVAVDEVLITSGAQGGLFAAMSAYLAAGDLALVPDPGFPSYRTLAELSGAEVTTYVLGDGFRLDPAAIETALDQDPRIRVVVLNHPGNPTGGGASIEALRRVAAACERHGVLLVSDEVYRELRIDSARDPSAESIGLRQASRSGVVVGSIAKAWGAPGLRVGWLLGDPAVLEVCRAWHAWAVTSAAGPSQAAARALVEASDEILPRARDALRQRWQAFVDGWRIESGSEPPAPDGGFYVWFRLPDDRDTASFCAELVQVDGVAVVPGEAFGAAGQGWARLSFGGEPDAVREGGRRVARALARTADATRGVVA